MSQIDNNSYSPTGSQIDATLSGLGTSSNSILDNWQPTITPPTIDNTRFDNTQDTSIAWQKSFGKLPPNSRINAVNIKDVMENIARNQSIFEISGKAIGQAVIGELVGGTLAGFGAIPKIVHRFAGTQDAFQANMLEQIGMDIQDWSREAMPIYKTQRANEGLAFGDATWWGNLVPSVVSSLSIMLPAGMMGKLVSMVGRAGRSVQIANAMKGLATLDNLGDMSRTQKAIFDAANLAKRSGASSWDVAGKMLQQGRLMGAPEFLSTVLMPAFISRQLDSSREALGSWKEVYEGHMELLKDSNLSQEEKESRARALAGNAAHKGYLYSQGNIVFDMFAWTQLSKLGRTVNPILRSGMEKALFQNAGKSTLAANVMKTGKSEKILDFAKVWLGTGFSEGFDEMFMDIAMKEGRRGAMLDAGYMTEDKDDSLGQRVKTHIANPVNWDSFVGGFLGGIVMGGAQKGIAKFKMSHDKGYQESLNKMAETFSEDINHFTTSLATLEELLADPNRRVEATFARNALIQEMSARSGRSGSLAFYIEALSNMKNMTEAQLKELGINDKGNLNDIIGDLTAASEIYFRNNERTYFDDASINQFYNNQISDIEVKKRLMEREIERISKDSTLDIDTQTLVENLEKQILELENSNPHEALYVRELLYEYQNLDDVQNQIDSIYGTTLALAQRNQFLTQQLDSNITPETKILALRDIRENNKKLEILTEDLTKLSEKRKSQLERIDTWTDTSKKIVESHRKAMSLITMSEANSLKTSLEGVLPQIKSELEKALKPEYRDNLIKEIEKSKNEELKIITDEYIKSIENVEDESEMTKLLEDLVSDRTGDIVTLRSKLEGIRDKKLRAIEAAKNAANARTTVNVNNGTSSNVVPPVNNSSTSGSPSFNPSRSTLPTWGQDKYGNNLSIGDKVYYEDGVVPLDVVSINEDENGKPYLVLSNDIDARVEFDKVIKVDVNPMERFSELARDIFTISNNIKFSESTKEMSMTVGSRTVVRTHAISDVTKAIGKSSSNAFSKFGTAIDDFSRNFFNIVMNDPNLMGNITIEEAYKLVRDNITDTDNNKYLDSIPKDSLIGWLEYLNNVNENFKSKGFTIFANDIKVLDLDSGVGGTLDFLLVNENNQIIVLDLKALSLSQSYGTNSEVLFKHLSQVTAYATILQKQHANNYNNFKIAGVGIMLGKTTIANGKVTDFSNNGAANLEAIAEAYKIPLELVQYENGIIMLPYNSAILKSQILHTTNQSLHDALGIKARTEEIKTEDDYVMLANDVAAMSISEEVDALLKEFIEAVEFPQTLNSKNEVEFILELKTIISDILSKVEPTFYVNENNNLEEALYKLLPIAVMNRNKSVGIIEGFSVITDVDSSIIETIESEIQNIQSDIVEITKEMMLSNYDLIDMNNVVKLLIALKSYKTFITEDIDVHLDATFLVQAIYNSHKAKNPNITEQEILDLMNHIFTTILPLVKRKATVEYTSIANSYNLFHSATDSTFSPATGEVTKDGQVIAWESPDMQMKHDLFKSIAESISTVYYYENGKKIGMSIDKITDNQISSIIKSIEDTIIEKYRGLYATPNNETNVTDTANKNTLAANLDNVHLNGKVSLTPNSNGTISVTLANNSIAMFTIPNNKNGMLGIKMVDSNNRFKPFGASFFTDIQNIIQMNNNKQSSKELLNWLKDLNEYRLLYEQSKVNKDFNASKLNSVVKALNSETRNINEQALYDIIAAIDNNTSSETVIDFDKLSNVLNLMFYNRFLTGYDSYNPTFLDIKSRMTRFSNVAKMSVIKYNNLIKHINDNKSDEAIITKIFNSSVLISNERTPSRISEVVVPVSIDGTNSRIEFATRVGNNVVLSRTGEIITDKNIIIRDGSKKSYVLLKGVDGKLIPFPTNANTLANSYSSVDGNDYSNEAVDYVSTTLFEILNSTLQSQVGGVDGKASNLSDIVKTLQSRIHNSGLSNILIFNKDIHIGNTIEDGRMKQHKHSYFSVYASPNSIDDIEIVLDFTTFDTTKEKTIETYHKVTLSNNNGNNIVTYNSITKSNAETFVESFESFKSTKGTLISESELLKRLNSLVGGMLRQNKINSKGVMIFEGDNNTEIALFQDPITNKQYSSAYDYSLDTDNVYARVDTVRDEAGTPITNMDLFGTAKLSIDVGVMNITTFGTTNKNVIPIISEKVIKAIPEYAPVFNTISELNNQLNEEGLLEDILEFDMLDNSNPNALASTKFGEKQKVLVNIANDNLLNYVSDKGINNSAFALLHEQLHKVLFLAIYQSKVKQGSNYDNNTRSDIAKLLNSNSKVFVDNFLESFSIFAKDKNNVIKLLSELNLIDYNSDGTKTEIEDKAVSDYISLIENVFKNQILNNIIDAENTRQSLLEKGEDINGYAFAQELFTYYTNPLIMYTLSKVTTDGKFYTPDANNKSKNFLDKIIDLIMKMFGSIFTKLSKKNLDANFSKVAKQMLSDLYYQLGSGIVTTSTETSTETTSETEIDLDFSEDVGEVFSEIINIESNEFRDGSNYVLC